MRSGNRGVMLSCLLPRGNRTNSARKNRIKPVLASGSARKRAIQFCNPVEDCQMQREYISVRIAETRQSEPEGRFSCTNPPPADRVLLLAQRYKLGLDLFTGKPLQGRDKFHWLCL